MGPSVDSRRNSEEIERAWMDIADLERERERWDDPVERPKRELSTEEKIRVYLSARNAEFRLSPAFVFGSGYFTCVASTMALLWYAQHHGWSVCFFA